MEHASLHFTVVGNQHVFAIKLRRGVVVSYCKLGKVVFDFGHFGWKNVFGFLDKVNQAIQLLGPFRAISCMKIYLCSGK